ncbi:ATP-dependent zinc metalloprotease FtsH [Candidatus Uabimicrobium sp. HlEnr_7]|uniref:ATP-dependent zinc metalloprotease FtsH n=1 Tax=Candidatus Uabimicrobium helgolandensis TaxID=3095367 RepID=UPI003557EE3E
MRPTNKNENRFSFFYFVLLITIILLIQILFFTRNVDRLTYGQFKSYVQQEHRIQRCIISVTSIHGKYIKDEETWKKYVKEIKANPEIEKNEELKKETFKRIVEEGKGIGKFTTTRVHEDPKLVELLEKYGVKFEGERENYWGAMFFTWGLPIILLIIFFIILMRRMNNYGRDVMSFGKSRAKITAEEDTKTTFDEVAGCDEAKEELSEIVAFLKSPGKFEELGGKIPKGALLVGPPGTGKTLLARAVAGEAAVPFFNISGSEFVEMFVGVGASRVRDLFAQAKIKSPCIIFIDEIDAVGRHRGAGLGGGHDEREQTLNQLLAEMDGFESSKGIIILAATNRPDVLDPALLRPGRFDRQVVIDHPDIRGREHILKIHAKGKPLADEVDIKLLAKRTPGFSGADLANVMNEAALLAARKDKTEIQQTDIAEAVERVMAGPERRSMIISDKEKENTAVHECGHGIVAVLHPDSYSAVHKITIIPRGRALGYVLQMPNEDKLSKSKDELLAQICMTLGGRIAEEIVFGRLTTGAANDLQQITNVARSMVAKYGMSDMGPLAFEKDSGQVFLGKSQSERSSSFSEQTLNKIDEEVQKIVANCYKKTTEILTENRNVLDVLAKVLLKRESLEGIEFSEIVAKVQKGENIDSHFEEPAEAVSSEKVEESKIEEPKAEKQSNETPNKSNEDADSINKEADSEDENKEG